MTRPDERRLTTRKSVRIALTLWIILLGLVVIAAALVAVWDVTAPSAGGPEHAAGARAQRLEIVPQRMAEAQRAEKNALLERYAWVDEAAGIAAIPLEQAMRALAAAAAPPAAARNNADARDKPKGETGRVSRPIDKAPTSNRLGSSMEPVTFRQNLGARLPMQTLFSDASGPRPLRDWFDGHAVILVLGYYNCPQLCSTVMSSVLHSAKAIDLPHRVVAISIDPRETPQDGLRRYGEPDSGRLQLLTGEASAIDELSTRAGFPWTYDAASGQYSHPAGFIVATPDGRISRYFPGVLFEPRDVRLALIEASDQRIGTLAEQIILKCSHYDPVRGRYSVAVMALLRGLAIVLLLVLGVMFVRLQRRRRS